ncbi:uncharacterized protein LOC124634226 [Helicoverpa zea]|uniref:uncharacterized protein LOC124634226 n=1 Tax=Helicoverpa zea TaxID=7113 RepID=UPI001F58965B|nr:uncharacterized protein LOC124634226 [Helicoverpa zea]
MQIILSFVLGILSILGSNGKKMKIVIDTDDIMKLFEGVLSSNTIKNFAQQLIERDVARRSGYKNPYHPEDDLVNTFDTTDLVKRKVSNDLRTEKKDRTISTTQADSLEKQNDDYFLNNEVLSDDVLTENEMPVNYTDLKTNKTGINSKMFSTSKKQVTTRKPVNVIEFISNRVSNRTDGNQTHQDDRQNYKPRQTRFMLVGRT